MKKLLLGSTALVAGGLMAAPAMAADPIKIGVGGYYQFFVSGGTLEGSYALNGTSQQFKGINFYQEGEIFFTGQTKLDNGTTVGLTVELEGWNPPASASVSSATGTPSGGSVSQIDEAYLFAFGDWGRVEFGSRDPASYRMYYGTPSVAASFLGFTQHNSNATYINPVVAGTNKAALDISFFTIGGQFQDANRINYFTPRFYGLQIGVGYAPKWNGTSTRGGGAPLTGGTCGFTDAVANVVCATNDYSWQDIFDVGANYLNKFGDITVAAYGAFLYATFIPGYAPSAGSANLITGANNYNWKQWVAGLQFGWQGWTIGGAIGYDNNGLGANYYTGVDNDTRKYTAGIMYETGPWQVAFGWGGTRNTNGNGSTSLVGLAVGTNVATTGSSIVASSNAAFSNQLQNGGLSWGQETADKLELSASYALGPGIKAVGGTAYYNISGPSNATAQQSWQLFLGMDLRF